MHVQFTSYVQGDISKVSVNSKKETKTITCFTKFHLFFVLNQVWFNPFQTNVPFLYILKTSDHIGFLIFSGGIEMEH